MRVSLYAIALLQLVTAQHAAPQRMRSTASSNHKSIAKGQEEKYDAYLGLASEGDKGHRSLRRGGHKFELTLKGKYCSSGYTKLTTELGCRIAFKELKKELIIPKKPSFQDWENKDNWPGGCYYCNKVDGCDDGGWFNYEKKILKGIRGTKLICATKGAEKDLFPKDYPKSAIRIIVGNKEKKCIVGWSKEAKLNECDYSKENRMWNYSPFTGRIKYSINGNKFNG